MKKGFTLTIALKYLGLASVFSLFLMATGCNKDFENTLPQSFRNDTAGLGAGKKVLYIVLDGVTGAAVKTLAPKNIATINARALYSYDGLADDKRNIITNAAGWTNMFTGYDYTKSNITTEDFAGLNLETTPTIFTRIKSSIGKSRTISIASTAIFNDKLAGDATVKQNVSDDAAVKAGVVAELNTNNPTMVVAQFHSADVAGAANGYTASTPAYATAIQTIDGYIGEILAALQARKGYSGENWLIVVASNKGGGVSGGLPGSNIYNDASRNTYIAFYNPRFSKIQLDQPDPSSYPFTGSALRLTSTTANNGVAVLSDANIGDFGTSGEYTFVLKLRSMASSSSNYAHFCGNMSNYSAREGLNSTGWDFMTWGDSYYLSFAGGYTISAGAVIRDGKWHTLAFKLFNDGATRYVSLFQDGKKITTVDITGKNLTNPAALHMGAGKATTATDGTDLNFRDMAIYNFAMTDADLIVNMKKEISFTAPNPDNLMGWWPANEGKGLIIKDLSSGNKDFNLSGSASWISFLEVTPFVGGNISDVAFKNVPNSIDIPVLIYNWLNIAVPQQWALMGNLFTPTVTLPTN
ncbi:LamG-like jellyroll fold domain-containing protein [Pedobacter psychrodurus]|uniref:LamG-like jellyroll fold domain-containing protein n=1 Tax=Pedobacter psychrodurus TaxID=2530456 RepID=UPI002930EBE2|nr:DUF4983 domain-containing protein [Pedobacter psychrodurus]